MTSEIILAVLASLLFLLSLIINFLILYYFCFHKNPQQKTSFDYVLTDTFIFAILCLFAIYLTLLLGLLKPDLSYPVSMTLGTFFVLFGTLFTASILTTLCVKIAFIKYPGKMFEESDPKVRLYANVARFVVGGLTICLNAVGPIQTEFPIFDFLGIESPLVLRLGLGQELLTIASIAAVIQAERLASSSDDNNSKTIIRLAVTITLSTMVLALMVSLDRVLFGALHKDFAPLALYFFAMISIFIAIPSFIISRTENLKIFVQQSFLNLISIVK